MNSEWKSLPLGNLCDILDNQRKPITKRDRKPGEYPYYGATGIQDFVDGFLFDEPLVLVGEDGAKWASGENTAFAVHGKCWVNNHAHVLRPKRSVLLDNWLIHFLVHSDLSPFVSGLTVPKLNQGSLREIPVPVPPLTEQQRIVAILDEAFAGIATARAAAEQNRQNARALFESHLQAIFSQRGEGWQEITLEEAVDGECSLSYGIVQPGGDQPGGLPIVRPTDLGSRTIELEGLKRIDPDLAASYRRTTLRGRDLLLCVRGTTGMISIASETLAKGNVTRGIVPIHFDDTLVNQDFGYYLIRSEPVQKQIRANTYGTALMQINIRDVRKLVLPIPPRALQDKLVGILERLLAESQRLESLYQRKLATLDELKQSILHQAFSGAL